MVERRRLRARRGYSGTQPREAAQTQQQRPILQARGTGEAGDPSQSPKAAAFFFDPGRGSVRSQAPAFFGVLPPLGNRASWLEEAGAKPGGAGPHGQSILPAYLRVSASPRLPSPGAMHAGSAGSDPPPRLTGRLGAPGVREREGVVVAGDSGGAGGRCCKGPARAASPSCAPSSRPPLATSLGPSFSCADSAAPLPGALAWERAGVRGDAAP